jgi:ribosome maturation factor RimP
MSTESGLAPDTRFIREHGLAAKVAAVVEPVLIDLGYRLVRVQLSGRDGQTLQIMAERPDGTMTAGDCETVSKQVSPVLDVHDPIQGAFHLEISSPGIDRPLVRPSDFDTWAGYEAKIELNRLVSNRKRFRGIVEGFTDGEVRMVVELTAIDKTTSREVVGFPVGLIDEAHLVLTDDLIRESLSRAKKAHEARGSDGPGEDDLAMDGAEMPDLEPVETQTLPKPKEFNARGNYAKTIKKLPKQKQKN